MDDNKNKIENDQNHKELLWARVKDLFKGNKLLMASIFSVSIPTMMGMFFETTYDIINMAWVSRISVEAVAAVTIFATLFMMLNIINDVIGSSSLSVISRYFGAGNMEKTVEAIEQTIIFKFFLALIFGIAAALLIEPVLRPLASNNEVLSQAVIFGRIRFLTMPLAFSSYTVNTALRCLGDAKKPLYLLAFSSILNIILDPIFIFEKIPFVGISGFGMGIAGAAWATVICQTISFGIGLYILMSGRTKVTIRFKKGIRLEWDTDKRLLKVGWPSGIEGLVRNAASYVIMGYIVSYGVAVVAAYGICSRIIMLILMPVMGLEMGSSVIVGQSLGSRDKKSAEKACYLTALTELGIMLVTSTAIFIFPEWIMKVFSSDPEIVREGVLFMRVFAFSLLVAGPGYGMTSALFGAGHNKPSMLATFLGTWVFQIPLILLFSNVLHLGIVWVWGTYIVNYGVYFLVILYNIRKGDWLHVNYLES